MSATQTTAVFRAAGDSPWADGGVMCWYHTELVLNRGGPRHARASTSRAEASDADVYDFGP